MRIYLLILTIITTLFFSCATSFRLTPVKNHSKNQNIFYSNGNAYVVSVIDNTQISLGAIKQNDVIVLFIQYRNKSGEAINVFPNQIKVTGISNNNIKQNLKVYSADEYMRKIQNKQALALALVGVSNAVNSANSGQSTSTSQGEYDSKPFSLSTKTYDHSEKLETDRRNHEALKKMSQEMAQKNAITQNGLLKINTLFPDYFVSGKVMIEYSSADRYIIQVPFGNSIHEITFIP